MKKENDNCKQLEKKGLLEKGAALDNWRKHAENCTDCFSRIELIDRLQLAGEQLNETLGAARFELIRKAVADREKQLPHFQILKYAALLVILLGCVFFFRSWVFEKDEPNPTEQRHAEHDRPADLVWDDNQDNSALKYKMENFKRKVLFSDLRNEDTSSFDYKCRSIRKQAFKLKNAEQI